MCQTVHKSIAMLLVHPEAGSVVFLKEIVLQINKYEEKTLHNSGKRTVLVDTGMASVATSFAIHLIDKQIIVVCVLKMGKQRGKWGVIQAGQGTKTFRIILCSI